MPVKQLITSGGKFVESHHTSSSNGTHHLSNTDTYFEQFRTSGVQFRVVGVIGCQSSGKSTLLNELFLTDFPVLDTAQHGRRRTTQGVWISYTRAKDLRLFPNGHMEPKAKQPTATVPLSDISLAILDVEGTDSRERAESSRAFESCTSLFTLAMCDLVLLNVWFHDLGRYQASNFELLEIVFLEARRLQQSNSQLFRPQTKTRIIVVVRDTELDATLEEVRSAVLQDIEKVWKAVNQASQMEELFEIDVAIFPHRTYCAEEYSRSVKQLRESLLSSSPNGLLNPQACDRMVPLSDFETLSKSVWESIFSNMTAVMNAVEPSTSSTSSESVYINIPEHVVLTAQFQCSEHVKSSLSGIDSKVESLRDCLFEQWETPPSNVRDECSAICSEALANYDRLAQGYLKVSITKSVVESKRRQLQHALEEIMLELREKYVASCRYVCESGFNGEFGLLLGTGKDFRKQARKIKEKFTKQFENMMKKAILPDCLNSAAGDIEGELVQFDAYMKEEIDERHRTCMLLLPVSENEEPITAESVLRPKKNEVPWWRSLLIKCAILAFNYWQATRGQRDAQLQQQQFERDSPILPFF